MEVATEKDKQHHHGQGIAKLREVYKKTQKELAEQLGVTQQAVSSLERSKVVDGAMVTKIARIFGTPEVLITQYPEEELKQSIIEGNSFGDNTVIYSGTQEDFDKENTYHPLDQLAKIFQEKEVLYESLIKLEQQKADALQAELIKYNSQLVSLTQAVEALKKNSK